MFLKLKGMCSQKILENTGIWGVLPI